MANFSLRLKKLSDGFIPVAMMGVFMILSMSLLSSATENSSQFGRMHLVLVVINVIGLITLIGLIGINIIRLIRQYRRNAIGSKLTVRLVVIFTILSVVPVSVVFYFSVGFLQRSIDSWFDVRMDRAMQDSLELSRASLDLRMRELLRRTREMGADLADTPDILVLLNLNELRNKSAASEITLLDNFGRVIASSSEGTSIIIPKQPNDSILLQVKVEHSYVGLAPEGELGLHVRVAVRVDPMYGTDEPRILYALYPISDRINELADSVESVYGQYNKLVYLREPLKDSFTFTLSLVLLVSMLTAVWAAFFSAQRLVSPIRILAIGTRAVAAGIYDKKLPLTNNDELGELVRSFSDMTQKLAIARDEAKRGREQVERERAYLRSVLGKLSSGVITLDNTFNLRIVNTAASQILDVDLEQELGINIDIIKQNKPPLADFVNVLTTNFGQTDREWRAEVTLFRKGGNRTLFCKGASLAEVTGIKSGFVVVFDDVTALVKAQRDAAWGEVAQRLAHEIKNPLTPIQLSAERLRRNCLESMDSKHAELLDRSTRTIIEQVQSMKEMVNAFSEYARMPKVELQPVHLEGVVTDVLHLYEGDEVGVEMLVSVDEGLPEVEADPGRIRQLLHNLIKNALESTRNTEKAVVCVSLKKVELAAGEGVELRVDDNGPGIPDHLITKLFEPYTSTKEKGGGLGLAVVKRIVEEHSGLIYAENKPRGGASIVIQIPIRSQGDFEDSGLLLQQKFQH